MLTLGGTKTYPFGIVLLSFSKDWRRGPGSNRRIKVLQTSPGHLCLFVPVPPRLYFQLVKALCLQPAQPCLNQHPLQYPLQSLQLTTAPSPQRE